MIFFLENLNKKKLCKPLEFENSSRKFIDRNTLN